MNRDKEWMSFVCFPMGGLLPTPNHFTKAFTDFNVLTCKAEKAGESTFPWFGEDIVNSFDPSRLSPRVVIKLPVERVAAEKEINDLLAPHGAETPEMVEVRLRDSRFPTIPKIRSTLVAKRKMYRNLQGPTVRPW